MNQLHLLPSKEYQPVFDYLIEVSGYSEEKAHSFIEEAMPHLLNGNYVNTAKVEVIETGEAA